MDRLLIASEFVRGKRKSLICIRRVLIGTRAVASYWNEWFTRLLFLSDPDKFPLQLCLPKFDA